MNHKHKIVAVALVVSCLAPALLLADDVTDALALCARAAADIRAGSQDIGFERRNDQWEVVYVSLWHWPEGFNFGQLAGLSSLEGVTLCDAVSQEPRIQPSGSNALAALHRLRILNIQPSYGTKAVLKAAAKLPRLEELNLVNYGPGTAIAVAASVLHEFRHLRRLSLIGVGLTDDALELIAQNKNLEELDITHNHAITDRGLAAVARIDNLRVLKMSSCEHLTAVGLAKLKVLRKLRDLELGLVDGSDLAALHELPKLDSLKCGYHPGPGDGGLAELRSLSSLTIAIDGGGHVRLPPDLRRLSIDKQSLLKCDLTSCRQMASLELSCASYDIRAEDEQAMNLRAFSNLTKLRLTDAVDSDIKAVAALRSLRVLEVHRRCEPWYAFGDEGMLALSELHDLRSLTLDSFKTTDEGFAILSNFKDLQRLDIRAGAGVTDRGLANIWALKRMALAQGVSWGGGSV